ncbi:MAG: OmpA family protein, partial [Pseudomonadota bacterium]|nr:OmpA family protein [Pseudomonadota bacterium]
DRFQSNWDLSAARSAAVADYLLGNTEIQQGRLTVTGYADTKPLESNETAAGRAKNRRIEIIVNGG